MQHAEAVGGRRIAAGLIDVAVLAGGFVAMASAFGTVDTTGGLQVALDGGPALAFFALAFAYHAAFEALLRATPGKLLCGLRIAPADDRPLDLGRILVRTLLRGIDGLPVLYGVGLAVMASTQRRQRLGDLAARTVVVRARA